MARLYEFNGQSWKLLSGNNLTHVDKKCTIFLTSPLPICRPNIDDVFYDKLTHVKICGKKYLE